MADLTPMDEFLHQLPEDGLEKAKGHAGMWKKISHSTMISEKKLHVKNMPFRSVLFMKNLYYFGD